MKYNKSLLLLVISLLVLGNAKVFAMMTPPTTSNAKTTSFSMLFQLCSNFFITSKEEIDQKIETKKKELMTAAKILYERASTNRTFEGLPYHHIMENVKNLWEQLSYLYVSNDFERFFNKYGPDIIDDEKPLKHVLTKQPFPIYIHPDKYRDKEEEFTAFSKIFTIERRENPLKPLIQYINSYSANDIKKANNYIKNELLPIIYFKQQTAYKKQLLMNSQQKTLDSRATVDFNKATTRVECDLHIQNNKNIESLIRTGRLHNYEH